MRFIKALFLVGIDGFLWLLLFGSLLNHIIVIQAKDNMYADANAIPQNEYGLVLGTSKDGKFGLNPYFKHRMEAAITLYKHQKIKKIIVSGDNHILSYNETQDMTDYLVARGVPDSAIIQDYAGFRTIDSVIRAKKVFGCSSLTIISQQFHNERALYIAKYHGINAIGFNAEDAKSIRNYTHFREFFAKSWVFVDLYVLRTQPKFL